jgi:DNA mismatch repair protein MutL
MIRLLPDSVANQIAAGEVVQRPASVVKELLENAIDAGASQITLSIRDAGRTLIQVADNGAGMSDRDARMAFERHATSKISNISDLEHLCTFGFRGEALASIAAVAEVELKTRRHSDETGVGLLIAGSKFVSSEPVQCSSGSVFSVKNLFYNIPARRKFLKSDASELKHIINEFQRVAICNPNVELHLFNNGMKIYDLYRGNLKQRLAGLFGKAIGNSLVDVNVTTSMVCISGAICKPDKAKKTSGEQFFFVNNRFFRSPYFQKAVTKAYEQLLPSDMFPSFFLFFEIDPADIDVNTHPQKTEIKFENELAIWQILNAAVRESLAKYAVAPSIIFDMDDAPDIPPISNRTGVKPPEISLDRDYNPFGNESRHARSSSNIAGWEQFYRGFDVEDNAAAEATAVEPVQKTAFEPERYRRRFLQVKDKYIVTPVKSGLLLVDVRRAHRRILFEHFLSLFRENSLVASQKQLFPETVELPVADCMLFTGVLDELRAMGFDVQSPDAGVLVFHALPSGLEKSNPRTLVDEILRNIKDDFGGAMWNTHERLSLALAESESLKRVDDLSDEELEHLVDKLFACQMPDIDPKGKPAVAIISVEDMDKMLLKN